MSDGPQIFDVLINRRSGGVIRTGEKRVMADLRAVFGARAASITFVNGAEIAPSVRRWTAEHGDDGRGLIVGGGDGTLLAAVEETLDRPGVTLGVLPLGTQNFLSRELGFSMDYKEAAAQYLQTTSRCVDVGEVNGMPFLYGLLADPHSLSYFRGREAVRSRDFFNCLKHIFSCVAGTLAGAAHALHVGSEGKADHVVKGHVILVAANPFAPRPTRIFNPMDLFSITGNAFGRAGECQGRLALYAFTGGVSNFFSVVRDIVGGRWLLHKGVSTVEASHLVLQPPEGAGAPVTVVLDGEIRETRYPLDVRIRPEAVRLYRPVQPA